MSAEGLLDMETITHPRPQRLARWAGALLLSVGLLAALPACSSKDETPIDMGHQVKGKVTYKGKPVPWGFVLFYSFHKRTDPKTGAFVPTASAMIRDGEYLMPAAPGGPVKVCVATDPDSDPSKFLLAAGPQGRRQGAGPPGGPPDKKGPGGFPPGLKGDPKGDPKGGLKGDPKGGPPGGFPPGLKEPPGGFPEGAVPKIPVNPFVKELTDAQKTMLREIHARYGTYARSPLLHVIKEGEAEQTYDIILKK